jgi:hypothetical protein
MACRSHIQCGSDLRMDKMHPGDGTNCLEKLVNQKATLRKHPKTPIPTLNFFYDSICPIAQFDLHGTNLVQFYTWNFKQN